MIHMVRTTARGSDQRSIDKPAAIIANSCTAKVTFPHSVYQGTHSMLHSHVNKRCEEKDDKLVAHCY